MPWELSSVLSRLRSRVVGHSTAESLASPVATSNPLPELKALTASIPHELPGTSPAQHLPIDRKILHDPSSYLDAGGGNSLPRGLMPSTRRYSADGSSKGLLRIRRPRPISDHLSEVDDFVAGSSSSNNPPPTQSGFNKGVSNVAAGGWPTFGRNHEHQVPNVVDFPSSPHDAHRRISYSPSLHRTDSRRDKYHSTESIQSTFTLSHLTNHSRPSTATHEVASSLPSTKDTRYSPNNRSSSKCSSPTNTMSSRYPQTPQRPRSYADPVASHGASSVTHYMTPVTQELSFDSPRTFGYPTPPDKPSRFSFTCSSPPPMPPLDHPELAAARSSRSKSTLAKQPALPALRDRSNTLPGRLSRKDDLLSSLSFTFGRSVHHHSSLPRVQQVSDIPMLEHHEPRSPNRPRRARTVSGRARHLRRTSADWSSHQATVGVNSRANQAWPAEVSREILRLSLGEGLELSSSERGPRHLSESSAKNKSRPRGDSTQHLPDQATESLSFFPFPHPSSSRAHSPPPLKEPATLSDGRDIIPSRPYSLQFNLGNRRVSEQPVGTTMPTEVKRSVSAVEPRNGPKRGAGTVKDASSDSGNPAMITPKKSQLLHPSSALTSPPSRTLFSGRPTPATNIIVSASMDVPSTPTPASRHLSDKSKGKRKAEDIDLTPPDQKKEGQRATFVLPSESRSQRISNSSHAPSSYHRKRARLSAASAFVTPVQSRPPSVQEMSHSRNNTGHFASLSSSTGARIAPPLGTPSRAASTRSQQPQNSSRKHHERHQSMSQISIPISAFVSPHAPSVSTSTRFHMRDPRKPPKKPSDTEWGLRFATDDTPRSPSQAWCFFLGFVLFPVWWVAALFLRIPETRVVGDADVEKAVTIDDPQIEHDAKSWRFRCRVMAVVSLFTYIPFIILIAIFVPR